MPSDVVELSIEFAAMMVSLAKGFDIEKSRDRCRENLSNGKAYDVFAKMVGLHGGDLARFEDEYAQGGMAKSVRLKVERAGYVSAIDAERVARVAFMLGAGRGRTDDTIDPAAGVLLAVTHGDRVEPGQEVATLFAKGRSASLDDAAAELASAFSFSADIPPARRLIL